MSGTALVVVIIVAVLVVIAAAALLVMQNRRRGALKDRFGPEYDRTIDITDSKRKAERELREREARRNELDIRDLSPEAAKRYQEEWGAVQQRFVDEPVQAVTDAQSLVTGVMRERGYPTSDSDERESMLSVDHADVMDRYRSASAIEARSRTGKASTEDLRQAMQHYRALFDRLLGDSLSMQGAGRHTDTSGDTTPSTGGTTSGTRGTPTSPDA